MNKVEQIRNLFPANYHTYLGSLEKIIDNLQEIRIRVNCPCSFVIAKTEYFPDERGGLHRDAEAACRFQKEDISAIFNHICKYSPYAFESQLKQGFITVAGGHRIGMCGQVVMEEKKIALMKHVSFLHIRIVHELPGIGQDFLPYLYKQGCFLNTLIISPPGCGKTTLLRDLTKSISDGNEFSKGRQVCLIDERSEIAGSFMGVPQNRIGIRTDVLDACPKALGMMMAIRAMGPEILVVDELGLRQDYDAVNLAGVCGIKLLASAHGEDYMEVSAKVSAKDKIIKNTFERIIVLNWQERKNGKKEQSFRIYDAQHTLLAKRE